jgi:hypothetical protein
LTEFSLKTCVILSFRFLFLTRLHQIWKDGPCPVSLMYREATRTDHKMVDLMG